MRGNTLHVGFGEADIQAPLGASMPGYFSDRKAEGVLDPLMAKAIAVRGEGVTGALVALDLIGLNAPEVARCREAASKRTGIPRENIWVHATHCHTGTMVPRFFTSDAEEIAPGIYVGAGGEAWAHETLPDRVAVAVSAAVESARSGPVELSEGIAPGLAFYRRFRMKDGTVQTNPGRNNPKVERPNGDADPTLTILRFPASRTLLVVFGLHPDTVSGTRYSADYPAQLTERIRSAMGRDWGVLFLNAACGDINHIDVTNATQQVGPAEARRIGFALGDAVVDALKKKTTELEDVTLRFTRKVVPSRLRTVPEEVVQQAFRLLKEDPERARSFNGLFAPAATVLGRTRDREQSAEISALRIGSIGLAGMPGEYFVELARIVQHDSPFDPTRVIGLTNGSLGYIPHQEAYDEGGYESGYRSARFRPGTGELWARTAVDLLRSLT